MSSCTHPVRIGGLCGMCGVEIGEDETLFCALYDTDGIRVTQNEAEAMHSGRLQMLETSRKLILVLDLDQTILHTVCNTGGLEDTLEFEIGETKFCVKLRPGLQEMLRRISTLYEIHVYTMGTREYARKIVESIDPTGEYIGDRFVTRDENQGMLIKNLNRLFPHKHRNVVVLDDRPDVWEFCKNLVLVKPFWYFNRVDINDPEMLGRDVERLKKNEVLCEFASKRKQADEISDPRVLERLDDVVFGLSAGESEKEADTAEEGCGNRRKMLVEDGELSRVTKLLEQIHRRYFKGGRRNVKKILSGMRKRVFGGSRFFIPENDTDGKIGKMVRMYGGKVCELNGLTEYIISSSKEKVEDMAKNVGCIVVSPKWVAECTYSMKKVGYGRHLLCDYRVKDEYEEELERLFG